MACSSRPVGAKVRAHARASGPGCCSKDQRHSHEHDAVSPPADFKQPQLVALALAFFDAGRAGFTL